MKTYQFRFNNRNKTSAILLWFFTALVSITLSITILVTRSEPYFPSWLFLISFPFVLISLNMLFKASSKRLSTEIIRFDKNGLTSACFGPVLFSDISAIKIPAREISLLGGEKYDYYKKTELYTPNLVISITTANSKVVCWVLNEWGGVYNSKEDFNVCFEFLTALTDQMYQYFHADEPPKSYLKILDENGNWQRNF